MAKRTSANGELQVSVRPDLLQRIVNLAALLVVRGESQTNQILMLAGAGFSSSEIANLLGTTTNTVSVTLYQARSNRKTKKKKA
jgi:DNA-directed RNA polymerase specialized sigma24 family protein